jgi:hypothetical protein
MAVAAMATSRPANVIKEKVMHLQAPDIRNRVYFMRAHIETIFAATEWPDDVGRFTATVQKLLRQQVRSLKHDRLFIMDYRLRYAFPSDEGQPFVGASTVLDIVFTPGINCGALPLAVVCFAEMLPAHSVDTTRCRWLRFIRQNATLANLPPHKPQGSKFVVPSELILNLAANTFLK